MFTLLLLVGVDLKQSDPLKSCPWIKKNQYSFTYYKTKYIVIHLLDMLKILLIIKSRNLWFIKTIWYNILCINIWSCIILYTFRLIVETISSIHCNTSALCEGTLAKYESPTWALLGYARESKIFYTYILKTYMW